jgi:hypothetical protein
MYQTGFGVTQDRGKAVDFYKRAGEHGFPGAWFALGGMYQAEDPELSAQYYRKAQDLGYVPGQPFLGPKDRSGGPGAEQV